MRVLCLALLCVGSTALAGTTNSLRVLSVYSNCFDYVFSSIASSAGDRPTLAFNHLGGRTTFVKVGEKLDDYVVQSVEPRTEEVFNPTINAYQTVKTGSVVLKNDRDTLRLEMDRPLRQSGYLGLVAWLDTGATAYVRVGATVGTDPESVVSAIDPTGLTLSSPDGVLAVALATQDDRDGLASLWQRRQEEEAARSRVAAVTQQDAAMQIDLQARVQPQPQQAPVRGRRPTRLVELTFNPLQIVNVTQTRMPVAWAVVPVTKTINGKQVSGFETKEFTVPMPQFDRIEYRGTIMTYAQ
jgi:hypothetical protein